MQNRRENNGVSLQETVASLAVPVPMPKGGPNTGGVLGCAT
jgi:hypothetical protein